MNRPKLMLAAVTTIALLSVVAVMATGFVDAQEDHRLSPMHQKMSEAQNLLRGLALEDYEGIKWSAQKLSSISIVAMQSQPKSGKYAVYGDQFRSALKDTISMAEEENLEGATLHFMETVMTCVRCHKEVRDGQSVASLSGDREWSTFMATLLDVKSDGPN